ncbi:MAG: hypothetical protein EBU90_26540 [Proteobacteria bacterium]|nr:hypothetical protein [Pseudomonadota bacterium]
MDNLINYLIECNNKIGKIKVSQDFINYRDNLKDVFRPNSRSETQRTMNADCVLFEYQLLLNKFVHKPTHKGHDFIWNDQKVDLKLIASKYFNIPDDKVMWYMNNIHNKEVTSFVFYKYENPPERPLVVGDTVSFRIVEAVSAKEVMDNIRISNKTNGYYYIVNDVQ